MNRFSLKTDHGKSISWKINDFPRVFWFFALWPGWSLFFLPESSIPTTLPCFFIFVALPSHPWPSNLTQTAFISLFHPPSLNFLPHFFWVLLMFFQNPLFPPYRKCSSPSCFFYPGFISLFFPPCLFLNPFFYGSCLCFFKTPSLLTIEFFTPLGLSRHQIFYPSRNTTETFSWKNPNSFSLGFAYVFTKLFSIFQKFPWSSYSPFLKHTK